MDRKFYGELLAHHGAGAAAWHAAIRAANRVTRLQIYRGLVVTMQTVDPGLLTAPRGQFLDPSQLRRFAANPENDLDAGFVEAAISRSDQCYAFVEGDVLSSHGWYAMYAPAVVGDTRVHFSSSYAFRYRGFTHPHFRGRHLRAIGMARALEALTADGKKGLVTQVGFEDFHALQACLGVGFRPFGHALLVKLGSGFRAHATPGCREYRYRVGPAASAPAGARVDEPGTLGLDPRTE